MKTGVSTTRLYISTGAAGSGALKIESDGCCRSDEKVTCASATGPASARLPDDKHSANKVRLHDDRHNILLIGKDSGVKNRSRLVNLRMLFALIYTMPMRQVDMGNRALN